MLPPCDAGVPCVVHYSDKGLVVDLIVDLNFAGARRAPRSLRAKQEFRAWSTTANSQSVWCILHVGGCMDLRSDERGVIHGGGCFTYDPSRISRLVLSASSRQFIWRRRCGLFCIATQHGC